MNTAAKVAQRKAARPNDYCPAPRCLWRTHRDGVRISWCGNHERSGADGGQQGAGESVIGADLMDSPDMRARPAGDRPEASGVIPCAAEGDDLSASVPARSAPSGGQQGAPVSRTGEGLIPPGVPVVPAEPREHPRCSSCGDIVFRTVNGAHDEYHCPSCGILVWEPVWRTDAEQAQYEQEQTR